MKKIIGYLGVLSLVVGLLLSTLSGLTVHTAEVTGAQVSTTISRGGVPLADGGSYSKWDNFQVSQAVTIPDSTTISAGDTLTLSLPDALRISAGTFEIKAADGSVVGTAAATGADNTLTVTFNDYFTSHKLNKKMTINYGAGFNNDDYADGTNIALNINGQIINVTKRDTSQIPGDEIVTKWGVQDKNNEMVINWFIRVNANLNEILDAKVSDIVPAGQVLLPNSFRARYATQFSPNINNAGNLDPSAIKIDGNSFTITFGDLTDKGAYVEYQTRIVAEPTTPGRVFNSYEFTGNGQVIKSDTRNADVSFKNANAFGEDHDYIEFTAKKELKNGILTDGQFQFELFDVDNNKVLETKTNDAAGDVKFSRITYDKEGTFNYQIREVNNNLPNIEYDAKLVRNVTVTVTDKGGIKVAKAVYEDGAAPIFNNEVITTTTTTTTTATTTTMEASTTSTTTTTEASTTSTTTTTEAPTTSTTTTTEAPTTSTTTTTEASTTSTTATTTGSTTTVTTTEAPTTTTTAASTTTTKPVDPATTKASTTTTVNTTKPSAKTTVKKSSLPSTGEQTGLWTGLLGVILMGSGLFFYRSRKNS
ncbi:collagen binding domain-containing protein [Streptococcus ferus]|uniref:collagen binding domain-containing protein n=1 Tax=Streptococcus ferus TaxID=1345 RepID=UPI002356D437|nr:collagen binding domain-containing protein [Streptococcus ferus]